MISTLFLANAIAHLASYQKLKSAKDPNAIGVLVFMFINAVLAELVRRDLSWSYWPALLVPAIGGLGLLLTTIVKGKAGWIDYLILVLDIALIILVFTTYF